MTLPYVPDLDPTKTRFQALYFVYFISFSGFTVFRNVYLEEIGMTGFQMGMIGFVLIIVGVLAQPAWGLLTDWKGIHREVLIVGAVASALGLLAYPIGDATGGSVAGWEVAFIVILVGTGLYSLFQAPIVPIANSLVLAEGFDYGRIRAFGSISFGIGSLGIGVLLATFATSFVVFFYLAGMVVIVALIWNMPARTEEAGSDLTAEAIALLTRRPFLLLLSVAFLLGMASSASSAFFSVYMRAIGAGDSLTGLAWAIKTVFEAVTFLYVLRFGVSYRLLLVVGAAFNAVTNLVYFSTVNPIPIMGAQLFAGIGYATFYLAAVNLAHDMAPGQLKSTAQTVLAAAGIGAGGAVGQVIAGHLMDLVGVQDMYVFLAAFAGLAALVGLLVRRRSGQ